PFWIFLDSVLRSPGGLLHSAILSKAFDPLIIWLGAHIILLAGPLYILAVRILTVAFHGQGQSAGSIPAPTTLPRLGRVVVVKRRARQPRCGICRATDSIPWRGNRPQ